METKLIYASSGCPNNVDNSKQIRPYICKDLHISNRICFERETPNRFTWTMNRIQKQSHLHVLTYRRAVTRVSVQLDDSVRRSERVEDGETTSLVNKRKNSVNKRNAYRKLKNKPQWVASFKHFQKTDVCWTYTNSITNNVRTCSVML